MFILAVFASLSLFSPLSFGQESGQDADQEAERIQKIKVRSGLSLDSFLSQPVDKKFESEDISRTVGTSVTDIVDLAPGIDNLGGPRRESQAISIRAFRPKQVLYLLDGTRLNFRLTHNAILPVKFHLLKAIDLVKGGASARFGNGAVGGFVGFSTVDPQDLLSRTLDQQHFFEGGLLGSSVSDFRMGSLTAAHQLTDQLSLAYDVTASASTDIQLSDSSKLSYSGFQESSFWTKGFYQFSNGNQLRLVVDQQSKASLTPFNPTVDAFTADDVAKQEEQLQSVRSHFKMSDQVFLKPEFVLYQNKTLLDRSRLTDGRRDQRLVNTVGIAGHGSYEHSWGDGYLEVHPGFEMVVDNNTGNRDGGPLSSFPNGQSSTLGAYTSMTYWSGFGGWLTLANRYDEIRLKTPTLELPSRVTENWSPEIQLGMPLFQASVISVGYRKGINAPKVQDIYVDGLHFADGFRVNQFVPNPDLRPERSETVELKAMLDLTKTFVIFDEAQLEWTEYSTQLVDYIDQEIRFFANQTQFVNRDLVSMRGRELEFNAKKGRWQGLLTLAETRAHQVKEDIPLANAPQDTFGLQINYRYERARVGIENLWFAAQDRIDPSSFENVSATPAFELQNLFMEWRLPERWAPGVFLKFRVNNLLDRLHRRHGTPLNGPGRDIRLELRAQLF